MSEKTILRALYVCYLSIDDPLVHTQVVAYLEGLATRGHVIHLLTFDRSLPPERQRETEQDLQQRGIAWHSLRYHKRPSLLATMWDVTRGAAQVVRLVRHHRLEAIHARSHVPAAMALIALTWLNRSLIFDVRGLMADEYADAGRWRKDGLAYRLTERVQRKALARAEGVVMLTHAVDPYLHPRKADDDLVFVIPCCADLEKIESWMDGNGSQIRAMIGAGDRLIMVYVGKFTGWYMERQMADFFVAARKVFPELFFLILTQADPAPMLAELDRNSIAADDYSVMKVDPDEIGRWLAPCAFGVSFVRPAFSKCSSSPTKIGEYLGAGLPVVSTAGIGDIDSLLEDDRVGVLIRGFEGADYESAANAVRKLCQDPDAKRRCRETAHNRLSLTGIGIPRYDDLYRRIAEAN